MKSKLLHQLGPLSSAPAIHFSRTMDSLLADLESHRRKVRRGSLLENGQRKPARKPKQALPRGIQHPDNRRQGGGGRGTPLKKHSASGLSILSQIIRSNTNQFGFFGGVNSQLFNFLPCGLRFTPIIAIYPRFYGQSIGPMPHLWTILSLCENLSLIPGTGMPGRLL